MELPGLLSDGWCTGPGVDRVHVPGRRVAQTGRILCMHRAELGRAVHGEARAGSMPPGGCVAHQVYVKGVHRAKQAGLVHRSRAGGAAGFTAKGCRAVLGVHA